MFLKKNRNESAEPNLALDGVLKRRAKMKFVQSVARSCEKKRGKPVFILLCSRGSTYILFNPQKNPEKEMPFMDDEIEFQSD